eukprot:TRINITY_DN3153_c0_g1_i3.p1 TRINITY_DN3153_c0_g1~~TRINITY_DN3153_c0_g1_i3.p1  ORF type:complete len:475 (+),score=108.32 TRINITY_DN3153_c0_g1_i3:158-1582(+)
MLKTLFGLALIAFCLAAPEGDLVDYNKLKGLPENYNRTPKMYSGYLNIPGTQKKYHYVFFQSQSKPFEDPVVLWLNGGPGCSSMEGVLAENGPFLFPDGKDTFFVNQYSWNKEANVLYIESPIGVGFTFSPNPADAITGDNATAANNLQVILQFFEAFPEYKSRDLYYSGESYAGVYIPLLAVWTLEHNKVASPDNYLNLKGILVGNGVTDWNLDTDAADFDLFYYRALYADDIRPLVIKYCVPNPNSVACVKIQDKIAELTKNINIYNIYGYCWPSVKGEGRKPSFANWKSLYYKQLMAKYPTAAPYLKKLKDDDDEGIPCANVNNIETYLNDDLVRDALHIDPNAPKFAMCHDIPYTMDLDRGSYWAYPILLASSIRVLVYSGDVDGSVPTLGTMRWLRRLQREYNVVVKKPWRTWFYPGRNSQEPQVGGFIVDYDNDLTFITIRGAGHMVPQTSPAQAYVMFSNFIKGLPF